MKTKWICYLACLMLCGFAVLSHAEVIGDFEDGLDGWNPWPDNAVPPVLETSSLTEAVTSGRQCLRVTSNNNVYWALTINAPNDIDLPESLEGVALQFDVTMIQSEWTSSIWTKVANAVALASNGPDGWKEFQPSNIIDRVSGEVTTSWDWGNWSADALKTIVVDISDYDLEGATYLDLVISIQQGSTSGAGYFYIDNIQLVSGAGGTDGEDLPTATDPVIASFEEDLDGWEIQVGELGDEILFSDVNGVTDGNYCLDVWFPENGWYEFLVLDVMDSNDKDVILENQKIAMDITRVADDYPDYPSDPDLWPWNNFNMALEVWDNQGNGIWTWMGQQANWTPREADPNEPNKPMTMKAVWDYGKFIDANIPDRSAISTLRLILTSNTNSDDYDGSVWFYLDNIQVFGGGKATGPNPDHYGIKVPVDSTASWKPGAFAESHQFYFGSDATAVRDANLASDPNVTFMALNDNKVDLAAFELDFATVYYWRVDEINEAHPLSPWKGDVWRFTTADFWVVDGFEDYNDYTPDRVFDTWSDGWDIDENGAQIGYGGEPFCEGDIVHGGLQSAPLFYDNTDDAIESVVSRSWDEPQNFNVNGYNVLSLAVYGENHNDAGQLSITLTDSSTSSATVASGQTDFFELEEWTVLTFPLQDFVDQGLDVTTITGMAITITNLDGQAPAEGDLLIDDIIVGP